MSQQSHLGTTATTVTTHDNFTCVIYNHAVVVAFNATAIKLNSSGRQTATTKTRMNQVSNQFGLGFRVYTKNYSWYVDFNGQTIPFRDNMILQRP